MALTKPTGEKEITYNPNSEISNGIEVAPSAITAIRSGVAMTMRITGIEAIVNLNTQEDGKAHLNTKLALIALYGMNLFAEQSQAIGELYAKRRRELAEAICQKAYGLRLAKQSAPDLDLTYVPEPTAVNNLLNDEVFLREMLTGEDELTRIMNYMDSQPLTQE